MPRGGRCGARASRTACAFSSTRSRCSGVESLGILADHDAAGAGERAAREVEARWRAAGTEVRIFMWEKLGDINDALRQGAAMSSSPEEILAHLRMHEIPKGPSKLSQASEDKDGFLRHSPQPSSSSFAQKVEEIADELRPVEVLVPRGERAKLSDMRNQNPRRTTPHQRPLIFADHRHSPRRFAAAQSDQISGPGFARATKIARPVCLYAADATAAQ